MSDDKLEFQGIVLDSNKGIFNVAVAVEGGGDMTVKAKLSGKLRINDIRIIVGDIVLVECSPYDLTMGRITRRFKIGQNN